MKTLIIGTNNSGETLTIKEYETKGAAKKGGIALSNAQFEFNPEQANASQITLWKRSERMAYVDLEEYKKHSIYVYFDPEICSVDWE